MTIDTTIEENEIPGVIESFLGRVRAKGHVVEDDKLIARRNVYRVDGGVHLLVRTSRYHNDRKYYFFGLTRHIFENFAQLPNAVIAFVFADSMQALLVPAQLLFQQREKISANRKQYKLEIDKSLRLRFWKPKSAPLDLSNLLEKFDILDTPVTVSASKSEPKALINKHAHIQGMLLEIGNARGFQTYCPNKSWRFKDKVLGDIATIKNIPDFPGLDMSVIRQIDVIWLNEKSIPIHAFEVELTTGIWSGLIRLAELKYFHTGFHVVTNGDEKAFKKRITQDIFADIIGRCQHATTQEIQDLYEAEIRVTGLRNELSI